MRNGFAHLAAVCIGSAVHADTLTVNWAGGADYTTIQAAIDDAADGDTVLVYPGTYTAAGAQVVDMLGKQITLRGRIVPETVVIDGQNSRQGIVCEGLSIGAETVIATFTITNCIGTQGGGIVCYGSPTISDCIISDNSSLSLGGGLYIASGSPTITNCTFADNDAANTGGGIAALGSDPPVLSSVILCGNDPTHIYGGWVDGGDNCLVFDCTDGNGDGVPDKCGQVGDGVHHVPAEFPTIQAAITAAGYGDEIVIAPGTYTGTGEAVIDPAGKTLWIYSSGGPDVTIIDGEGLRQCLRCVNGETEDTRIEGLTLFDGAGSPNGGGIYCEDSWPRVTDCIVKQCTAVRGAGAYYYNHGLNAQQRPAISGCWIQSNTSYLEGAVNIAGLESQVEIDGTIFCGNTPYSLFGAWLDLGGNCIAVSCDDNDADGFPDKCASTGDGVHNVPSEYPTIQAAVDVAGDGDTVLVAPGTWTGNPANTDAVINTMGKRITILASGPMADTIIDGENLRRGLLCVNGEGSQTRIEGFTFENCGGPGTTTGGTALFADSSPTLANCEIRFTEATYGGSVYFLHSQSTLTGCSFALSDATLGGALCAYGSDLTINDTTFAGCTAQWGAAVLLYGESSAAFQGCVSGFNQAFQGGGMAYIAADCKVTFIDCIVGLSGAPVGPGVMAVTAASIIFEGENQCAGTWCGDPGSSLELLADAMCAVDDDVVTSPQGATKIDLDNLGLSARLSVDGDLLQQGSLGITNDSGSLSAAGPGDLIPLLEANVLDGSFSSVVMPVMPSGLGLQLVESSSVRGSGTVVSLEVIEVDSFDLDDPFAEDLDSPPVEMVSLDVDGDGADELAVLFPGTPGTVAVYQVLEATAPVLIPTLLTPAGVDPLGMDAGDLDGDGRDDLAIVGSQGDSMTLLMSTYNGDGKPAFSTTDLDVPGYGQSFTCVAVIDWDGDSSLDAAIGVDRDNPSVADAWQVMLDVGQDFASIGPTVEIPLYTYEPDVGDPVSIGDPPTCVAGSGALGEARGFCGGTGWGRVQSGSVEFGLQDVAQTGGQRVVAIEVLDMDEDGGDGMPDILAASEVAQSVYLVPGDIAEPDGYAEAIPIAVSEPVEDIVAIDADDDGDIDIVLASPSSTDDPLLLLRNDPPVSGLMPLQSRTWSKQSMVSAAKPSKIGSGGLNNKDDDDDWVIGGGEGDGINGPAGGAMEQTNMFPAPTPGDTCASAVSVGTGAHAFDTTGMTDSGFGDPDESQCAGTYLEWNDSQDAWFSWTPSTDGTASFTTCDPASYDTSMVLYRGSTCDALVQIACNGDGGSDAGCQSYYSLIEGIPVTEGGTMYVRLGGWNGSTGTGTVTIDLVTSCPEDIDGNGVVNIDDLLLVLANFGGSGAGDVDDNGVIDVDDLLLVIAAWEATC